MNEVNAEPATIRELLEMEAVRDFTERLVEYWQFDRDVTRMVMRAAHSAGCCGAPHHVFINRDGRTRCWACDDAYLQKQKEAA